MLRGAMYTTIQTLWNKGHNKSEIARLTGHDWKTISKAVKALKEGKLLPNKKACAGLLTAHHEQVLEWVEQGLTAVRIQEELLSTGVKASYSTVKYYVSKLKGAEAIFIRIHTQAGEEAQVDFGYVGYTWDKTGKRRKTWVFNMRLSCSRLDYYEIVYDQRVETFILCHIHAFDYFGGVPKTVKIDNLKAAILEAHFYEPVYQHLYQQFVQHYGFESIPCRIYRPNDKGKVESGIKYIKVNFFLGRKFNGHDDMLGQLNRWQEKANNRLHGTTKKIPRKLFEEKEKSLLLKLPLEEFQLFEVGTRKVYHDCHIYIHHNYYSVPYEYVGKEVEIELRKGIIKISFNHQVIAVHKQLSGRGEFSTKASHYPKYKCLSSTQYQEKYQAKMAQIGHFAEQLFFGFLTHKKNGWSRPVQGVLALAKSYSPEIVNRSCERALAYGIYEYQVIKRICQNGSYTLPLEFQGEQR